MPTLSVIIITKNEAHDIRDCLESIKWADEIIVLDSGSTDGTQVICREYTSKVFETHWPGYGTQKNRALQHATCEWILSLDADERINDTLKQQITHAISSSLYDAYLLPIQTFYCGKLLKHTSFRSEFKLRLFKKNHGKFDNALIHEKIIVEGKIGKLSEPIIHLSYKNFDEVLDKINRYSTDSASQHIGKKSGLTQAIIHGWWAFFRSYILRLGFLDGKAGFMFAVSNAEYSYYRYLKLMFNEKSAQSDELSC